MLRRNVSGVWARDVAAAEQPNVYRVSFMTVDVGRAVSLTLSPWRTRNRRVRHQEVFDLDIDFRVRVFVITATL